MVYFSLIGQFLAKFQLKAQARTEPLQIQCQSLELYHSLVLSLFPLIASDYKSIVSLKLSIMQLSALDIDSFSPKTNQSQSNQSTQGTFLPSPIELS